MTTRTETAVRILDRCAKTRDYRTRAAEAVPSSAQADRKRAAEQGWVSVYDDPNLSVRCSQLEDLCAGIISDRHRVALLDALSSVDDLAPVEVEAVAWLAGLSCEGET